MENKTNTLEKIKISPYSKIRVTWKDRVENYSKNSLNTIRTHFANKYGVSKNSINVVFVPVKFNANGDAIEVDSTITQVMDENYQRSLFKEWINREGKVVDFDRILKLDDKVNSELNIDLTESQHRKWSLK